jgi:hypothetical protein
MGATIEQYMDWLESEVPHEGSCRKSPEWGCTCVAGRVLDRLLEIGELTGQHSDDIELPG